MKQLSTIGVQYSDGSVRAIRVYGASDETMYDGQVLLNCWSDFRFVVVLIGMGDLSTLGPSVDECECMFRDLQTPWVWTAPQTFTDAVQWKRRMRLQGANVFYLFNQETNGWRFWDNSGEVKNLDEFLIKE